MHTSSLAISPPPHRRSATYASSSPAIRSCGGGRATSPHADDSAIPTWLLSQAVASRYKVALTGIGGDELFAGYRRHIGLLAAEQYAKLPAGVRRIAGAASPLLPEPPDGTLGIDRLKRF